MCSAIVKEAIYFIGYRLVSCDRNEEPQLQFVIIYRRAQETQFLVYELRRVINLKA